MRITATHVFSAASAHRLEQRIVLGIDRKHGGAGAAARRMNRPPAQTSVSLLASAMIAPRSAAASVGLSPAAPVIAPITQSAGPLRRLDHRAFARASLDSCS